MNSKYTLTVGLFVALCLQSVSYSQTEDSWNQWRGSNRNSLVKANWPQKLEKSNFEESWSKPFSKSYSGPILFGNTVITTETQDKKFEVVTALDKLTGKKIWSTRWEGAMTVPFFASKNGSWIRATPATDGQRVFVPGIEGLLVCLDFKTGETLWKIDLNKKYGVSRESFGHVCSPLLMKDDMDSTLYIQCSAGFLKLDRETGKEIWRSSIGTGNIMSGGAFSSPIVATLQGQKQIVIQTRNELAGIDIQSGSVKWKQAVPAFRGMNILTPTVLNDTVFTSSYNNKSYSYDVSQPSAIKEKWNSKLRAYMSSPVLVGKNVYVHLQNRQIASFNLETGATNWVSKSRKRFGEYMSMIACGDKILALDSGGTLFLFKADPKSFEIIGQVKLKTDDSWAHLAVDHDKDSGVNRVYVRGLNSLTMYHWK